MVSEPGGVQAPIVNVLSPTSIFVSWTAPISPNGVLQSYVVKLPLPRIDIANVSQTSLTVTGLIPFAIYSVTITACTGTYIIICNIIVWYLGKPMNIVGRRSLVLRLAEIAFSPSFVLPCHFPDFIPPLSAHVSLFIFYHLYSNFHGYSNLCVFSFKGLCNGVGVWGVGVGGVCPNASVAAQISRKVSFYY